MEDERDSLSIAEFCRRNTISRRTFYELVKRGEAPATFKLGGRTLIDRYVYETWRARLVQGQARGHSAA